MNNVGEFFFSSPIDPFDLSKDWGRSDDDQRHRLVISGALQSPSKAPTSPIQHLTHGFQLSAMLQAYSACATQHHLGVTTIQGTAGRPIVDGAFIPRNVGEGSDFLDSERPSQSHVSPQRPRSARSARGGLQPDQPCQRVDTQRQLRSRRVSVQSIANVRPDYRRGRTQVVSVRRARPILRGAHMIHRTVMQPARSCAPRVITTQSHTSRRVSGHARTARFAHIEHPTAAPLSSTAIVALHAGSNDVDHVVEDGVDHDPRQRRKHQFARAVQTRLG